MATATTDEVEDIRRRMAWIRRELHEDVRGVVQSAEAVTNWKHYIRDYPWASVAAAAAVGFWLVPKRRKSVKPAEVARAMVAEIQPAVQAVAAEPVKEEKKSRGLIGAGLGLLAPIVLRAAQNYATHFVTNWIAQQQADMAERMMAASEGSPPPGPGGPSRPEQRYSGGIR